jgi:hypothetical protein
MPWWFASSLRLQVLVFPFEADRTGLGDEPGFSSAVLYFPMLRVVVEFEVAGSGYLKPSQFMQGQGFGPEALSGSVGVE